MEIFWVIYIVGYVTAYYLKKWDDHQNETTWGEIVFRILLSLMSWLFVLAFLLVVVPNLSMWKKKGPKWL